MTPSSAKWKNVLFKSGKPLIRNYSAQSPIFFQGEIPSSGLYINSGFVVAYTITNSGSEQIVCFYSANDLIPTEWLFNLSPVSLYYYRAFTDCELISFNREELLAEIDSRKDLTNDLLHKTIRGFIGSTIHVHALEQSSARDKIIRFFHYLVLRYGDPTSNKSVYSIPFPLTHAQIASMTGLTRETVSVETSSLKKKGAIIYKDKTYSIILPRLVTKLGSEAFENLQM